MNHVLAQTLEYWRGGGILLIPIALTCLGIWHGFFRTRRELMAAAETPPFEHELSRAWHGTEHNRLVERLRHIPGFLPALAAHVLQVYAQGGHPGRAFDERAHAEIQHLKRNMLILAALTAVAPLLGLLGTVRGMIDTFDAVATVGGGTASAVASGISQALITTQFGLIVAIPGVFGLTQLARRLDQVSQRVSLCKIHLMLGLETWTAQGQAATEP